MTPEPGRGKSAGKVLLHLDIEALPSRGSKESKQQIPSAGSGGLLSGKELNCKRAVRTPVSPDLRGKALTLLLGGHPLFPPPYPQAPHSHPSGIGPDPTFRTLSPSPSGPPAPWFTLSQHPARGLDEYGPLSVPGDGDCALAMCVKGQRRAASSHVSLSRSPLRVC